MPHHLRGDKILRLFFRRTQRRRLFELGFAKRRRVFKLGWRQKRRRFIELGGRWQPRRRIQRRRARRRRVEGLVKRPTDI
jgi:hypothetical protein